jgi:Protein of unknown function (DUF3349)
VTRFLTAILNWLRNGYPEGIPPTDYLPVLALLPRHSESMSEYDLRNRDSAAVKAALATSCQVCEAGLGEDCQNLTNDFRLPRQRIVHFCRVPVSHGRRDLVISS